VWCLRRGWDGSGGELVAQKVKGSSVGNVVAEEGMWLLNILGD
jgi:hypothetical protein